MLELPPPPTVIVYVTPAATVKAGLFVESGCPERLVLTPPAPPPPS